MSDCAWLNEFSSRKANEKTYYTIFFYLNLHLMKMTQNMICQNTYSLTFNIGF